MKRIIFVETFESNIDVLGVKQGVSKTDHLLMILLWAWILRQQIFLVGKRYVHACVKVGMGLRHHVRGGQYLKDKISERDTAGGVGEEETVGEINVVCALDHMTSV